MSDGGETFLDELPLGLWVGLVPDARVVYANAAFREILGQAPSEGSRIGDVPTTYQVFDRQGRPFPVERLPFSQVLATGRGAVVDDLVIHRGDGKHVPIRAFGQPVRDGNGRITHVIVLFVDITRETAAEVARASVEAQLKVAIDHAPIALFAIDPSGMITLSEGAGLKALGVRSGDLVGKSVFELYRDHPTIPAYIRRGLQGDSFYYTVQVGEAVYDSWITPTLDANGAVTGVLGVSHDMSEPRRLQAAVIQNDRVRAMGTLAASVAHEINNPLTYVMAHLDQLAALLDRQITGLATLVDSPTATALHAAAIGMREELAPARQGVRRIATITGDLRTFSRPEDTRVELVDVRAVIESVLRLVRKDVEARAELRLQLGPTAPVFANEARLVQVVTNLIVNAKQALLGRPEAAPAVGVITRNQGDKVVIEVTDTGPGVPSTDRERIFEPFMTTKPVGEGTGLGLFVCRNIVRDLGGHISTHDRPGGGAVFRVELPAAPDGPSAMALARQPLSTTAKQWHVLVIDDDRYVSRALSVQLEQSGMRVEVVGDSATAAQILLGDRHFDLVYCDLMMDGMTGMDLADLMAARAPRRLARTVFMTGGAFTPRAAAFVASRAHCCVEKPFDIVAETQRRLRDTAAS